jgi:phosphopantothenoylcysteine decarboxylase/phosphopantothenate--cysteine ligase
MRAAVMQHLAQTTVVVGAAAVADFRMAEVSAEKLRRKDGLHLELEPTEDIVRDVSDARGDGTLVIAFAAEMDADVERAREKMRAKGADAIVLNDVSRAGIGFDSERNAAVFITAERAAEISERSKRDVAERILDEVVRMRANAHSSREAKAR